MPQLYGTLHESWSIRQLDDPQSHLNADPVGEHVRNDTIETLLLRHYGSTAQTPVDLRDSLAASIQLEAAELEKEQQLVTRLQERRISRRRAVRMVTLDAGLEGLSLALEGVRVIEAALNGHDTTKPAYS